VLAPPVAEVVRLLCEVAIPNGRSDRYSAIRIPR
jgi:hypothetical protein